MFKVQLRRAATAYHETGHDPEVVLRAAIERKCRVLHFEIADPSLEEIFIEHVGQIDASERTLAPKAVYA